jgi:hypothetical protein
MSLTISNTAVNLNVFATLLKSLDLPGAIGQAPATYAKNYPFTQGTGPNQADIVWHDERTLAGTTSENLDLTALTDAFGGAINLTKAKALIVVANPANNGDLQVGGGHPNGFVAFAGVNSDYTPGTFEVPYAIVKPGGMLVLVAPDANGYTVDSTHKILKVNNAGAGSGVYDIIVVGIE